MDKIERRLFYIQQELPLISGIAWWQLHCTITRLLVGLPPVLRQLGDRPSDENSYPMIVYNRRLCLAVTSYAAMQLMGEASNGLASHDNYRPNDVDSEHVQSRIAYKNGVSPAIASLGSTVK